MKKRIIDLTKGTIWKQVLFFAIPLLLSNLLQQLYSAVDLMIVGNFAGKIDMAAVGATTSITGMIIGLFMGLAAGGSVVVSQYFGAADYNRLQKSIHTAYAIALASGFILTVFGYFASPIFLKMMGTPAEILPKAVTYMRIHFAGSIPLLVYNIGAGILRSVGDSRRPFYFLIVSTFTNLILDIIFVAWLKLGVAGAGWATFISTLVSALLVTSSLRVSHTVYHLSLRKIKFDLPILKKIVKIGIPAGIQGMLISFSNVFIQAQVNVFGANAIAGVATGFRLNALVFSVFQSFSLSATTFSGQNMGAGLKERVEDGIKDISKLTFVSTLIIGLSILIFRYPLVALFSDSKEVVYIAARMISFMTPFYWILGLINVIAGYIRGTGESLRPMVIYIFGMVIVRLAYLNIALYYNQDLDMIFLSYPISWTITLCIMYLYYKKGNWKVNLNKVLSEKAEAI